MKYYIQILSFFFFLGVTLLVACEPGPPGFDSEIPIEFSVADAIEFSSPIPDARGTIVTNPPYGERMGEITQVRQLYKAVGANFKNKVPFWQMYIITSDEEFERHFGRRSDKKRVLYNGMIKCNLYQFFKTKK